MQLIRTVQHLIDHRGQHEVVVDVIDATDAIEHRVALKYMNVGVCEQ